MPSSSTHHTTSSSWRMANPPTNADEAVVLIQQALQVTSKLSEYYQSSSEQGKSLDRLRESLKSLHRLLNTLYESIQDDEGRQHLSEYLQRNEGWLTNFKTPIKSLQTAVKRIQSLESSRAFNAQFRPPSHERTYALRRSTMTKLRDLANDMRRSAASILGLCELHVMEQEQASRNNDQVEHDHQEDDQSGLELPILDWIDDSNGVVRHSAVPSRLYGCDGLLTIDENLFLIWFKTDKWLWIHPFASSTTVRDALRSKILELCFRRARQKAPRMGVCYVYFDKVERSRQRVASMLRAMLIQLSYQANDQHKAIREFWKSNKQLPTSDKGWIDFFNLVAKGFDRVYLLMSGHECCPEQSRKSVITVLQDLYASDRKRLQSLVITSHSYPVEAPFVSADDIRATDNCHLN